MKCAVIQTAALIIAARLLAGCSTARSADQGAATHPSEPGAALIGSWIAPNAKPDKGFTKLTFNADKTATGTYKHAVVEMRYDRHGMQQYIPDYKETATVKSAAFEWHADATHVWVNVKGQSSAAEWSYNVDGSTLTYGPDEATQYVMRRKGD